MDLAYQMRSTHLIRILKALLITSVALTLSGLIPPVAAQEAIGLAVTPAFDGSYAPDRWLPLSIVLRNNGPATRVLVAAELPNTVTRSSINLDLPGATDTTATLYVAMDRQARSIRVSVERGGSTITEQQLEVRPREGERMLALVAGDPFTLSLPRRQDQLSSPFNLFELSPSDLPDRPAGLSSLSLILLGDPGAVQLQPAQAIALVAWVCNGGHLIISGGSAAAPALALLPQDLHVAEIGPSAQLDPTPLAEYSGSSALSQLAGVTLRPSPDALSFGPAARPLWAQRDIGAGRVTQLAFDPAQGEIRGWPGAPALWDKLLQPVRYYNSGPGTDTTPSQIRGLILSGSLANLPAINLPDPGPLFLLLVFYTVLIGPGMALLLRRIDRQSAGWVLLPSVALLIFGLGTAMALAQRPDERIINQVSLVEQIDANTASVQTAMGVLSPRDERYQFGLDPAALTRPLPAASSRDMTISSARSDLSQNRGDLEFNVEAWKLQGLLTESLVDLPLLDAQITMSETAIEATVRNTTGRRLRDVALAYGGQVVSVGDLEPDTVGKATWPPPPGPNAEGPPVGTPLSVLLLGDELEAGRGIGGMLDRRTLIREALINAAVIRGSQGEDPGPLVLAWLDQSPLAFGANVSGAASQQISLLVSRPHISGSGVVLVPQGWLRLDPGVNRLNTCSGSRGRGIVPSPAPLNLVFQLPADLAAIRAESIEFLIESERTWPSSGVRLELYDWQDERWVEFNYDGPGSLPVDNAAAYVQGGRVQMRLSGRVEEAGCLFIETRLRGRL